MQFGQYSGLWHSGMILRWATLLLATAGGAHEYQPETKKPTCLQWRLVSWAWLVCLALVIELFAKRTFEKVFATGLNHSLGTHVHAYSLLK